MHSLHLRWLSSLDQRKRLIIKVIRWLLSFAVEGAQSFITHFCVDKLSELQIFLVSELAGNSHSAETSETDSGHGRVTG